jgi:hypothetical protein
MIEQHKNRLCIITPETDLGKHVLGIKCIWFVSKTCARNIFDLMNIDRIMFEMRIKLLMQQ